jgi:ABC-type transporter Mla subunit MlaD
MAKKRTSNMAIDPSQFASIFADELAMRRMVENIQRINDNVTTLAEKLGAVSQTATDITKSATAAGNEVEKSLNKASKAMSGLLKTSEDTLSKIDKAIQKVKGAAANIWDSNAIEKGSKGVLDAQVNPGLLVRRFISKIPQVGPLIEAFLNTAIRDDTFRTMGRRAVLAFRGTGAMIAADVERLGAKLGPRMRELEDSFIASAAELGAVWSAAASGGMKLADVVQAVSDPIKGFGDNVAEQSLALDQLFGANAGTSMTHATKLAADMGVGIDGALERVRRLGHVSRESGMHVQQFMGSMLQMTSTMRMQGVEADALANIFLNLKTAYKGAYSAPDGKPIGDQRAGQLAMAGTSGLANFITNLDGGLKLMLADQLAQKFTGTAYATMSETDKWAHMRTGFQSFGAKPDDVMKATFAALWDKVGGESNSEKLEILRSQGLPQEAYQALWTLLQKQGLRSGTQTGDQLFLDKFGEEFLASQKKAEEQAKLMGPLTIDTFTKMSKDLINVIHSFMRLVAGSIRFVLTGMFGAAELIARTVSQPGTMMKNLEDFKTVQTANMGYVRDSFGEVLDSVVKLAGGGVSGLDALFAGPAGLYTKDMSFFVQDHEARARAEGEAARARDYGGGSPPPLSNRGGGYAVPADGETFTPEEQLELVRHLKLRGHELPDGLEIKLVWNSDPANLQRNQEPGTQPVSGGNKN